VQAAPSAHAPVDDVPVANQGESEQQEGDQQQAGSFRGIKGVPGMFVGIVLALGIHHGFIVRRLEMAGDVLVMRMRASRGLVLHYASSIFHSVLS
jgi:hypothetical protein